MFCNSIYFLFVIHYIRFKTRKAAALNYGKICNSYTATPLKYFSPGFYNKVLNVYDLWCRIASIYSAFQKYI